MSDSGENTSFNNTNANDGRADGNWKTRYPDPEAQAAIKWEKNYLIILLVTVLLISLLLGIFLNECFFSKRCSFEILKIYLFGWLGGTLGGIIFSMKWLYHSVAKNIWNIDRRLWRIFTPHLSGALALIVIVLIDCKIFTSSNSDFLNFNKAFGLGFLVGYFSDNAIGKMTEMANVLFAPKK
jgi:hypothetical protein